MSMTEVRETIRDLIVRRPGLSRVFEQTGIDYCCSGNRTIEEACQEKGIDPKSFVSVLDEYAAESGENSVVDAASMSLTELADHIEETHHAYLRAELPRLHAMTEKVALVRGGHNPRLLEVKEVFLLLATELSSHMLKEERMLFPIIRRLDAGETDSAFPCGSISGPVRQMEIEHSDAGNGLDRLRKLTDGYTAPDWACNTYRAMLDGLARLEHDLHEHIHKENNILFPRALERECCASS